jgi:hypothetical protein
VISSRGEPVSEATRFLIVKSSIGAGLGDKLLAVISAIAYARLSGRTLHVDWDDLPLSADGSSYFDLLFRLRSVPTVHVRPKSDSVRPATWRGKLEYPFGRLHDEHGVVPWNRERAVKLYSFDQAVLDWPEQICVMWDFSQFRFLAPHLPGLYPALCPRDPHWRMQSEVLRTHVSPCLAVVQAMQPYQERFHAEGPVVGVHVRASDEHYKARRAPPVRAFLDTAAALLRKTDARILFLATDNRAVQEIFLDRFGESRVILIPKWLPEPGKALHLGGGSPDPLQSMRDALLDISLLAAADYLVTLGNSSFSAAARLFSCIPEDRRQTLMWRPTPWQRLVSKTGRIMAGLRQKS